MSDYLTPEIAKAIPMLDQTCDELTRQALIRALAAKTKAWCAGDPELAEWIVEEKKTLEGCIKYVLDQAMSAVAKTVAAMPAEEFNMLPTRTINGKKATGAGGFVGEEQAYQWAHDYYYKVKETKPNGRKGKSGKQSDAKTGKAAAAKEKKADLKAGGDPEAQPDETAAAPAPAPEGEFQQMMLGGDAA